MFVLSVHAHQQQVVLATGMGTGDRPTSSDFFPQIAHSQIYGGSCHQDVGQAIYMADSD